MKLIITEHKFIVQPGVRGRYEDIETEFVNVKEYTIEGKFLTVIYENGEREGRHVNEMRKFKLVKE